LSDRVAAEKNAEEQERARKMREEMERQMREKKEQEDAKKLEEENKKKFDHFFSFYPMVTKKTNSFSLFPQKTRTGGASKARGRCSA